MRIESPKTNCVTILRSRAVTVSNDTFVSRFAYTGAIIDTETGLYYMNARYYDPGTGRFISQDSYRGEGEAFWHLYAYCNGDPVNFHDPTGNLVIEITACSLVAIGVALYLSIDYAINRERSLLGILSRLITQALQNVAIAISTAISAAKSKLRKTQTEKHHIVAQKAKVAAEARGIIKDAGIGINSSQNTVYLKYWLHRHLHTDKYYKAVNAALRKARNKYCRDKTMQNIAIRGTLSGIKSLLQKANRCIP